MFIDISKWHVFFVTKMYRPEELKRKMYLWTCTKENLSCNLTCYNVQYVCIVFDWGNFYAEWDLLFFCCTYISDPVLLLCHPRSLLFVHFSLSGPMMINHALLLCVMIRFNHVAPHGEGHNTACRLNWCSMEWWNTQALFYTLVSVWSCLTLHIDTPCYCCSLLNLIFPHSKWVIFGSVWV